MSQPAFETPADSSPQPVCVLAGVVWFALFVWAFFAMGPEFRLPGDVRLTRVGIFLSMPELLSDWFRQATATADARHDSWRHFQWPLVLWAGLILAGALAAGRLVLRLLRVHAGLCRLERTVFAFACGMSSISLLVLLFGLAGWLNRPVALSVLAVPVIGELAALALVRGNKPGARPGTGDGRRTQAFVLLLVAPVLLMVLTGALSPPTDFDVREYHLQGPKEFFQHGRISFLAHNVYTSFPFLTEMFSLLGMVLTGDWYRGALVGKVVLASFAPATALALVAAGGRCFDCRAGWLAAMVYLTAPWTYRISTIAYSEGGLAFFLFASLLAVMLLREEPGRSRGLLLGAMCGSAMACKYPALVSVVLPGAAATLWIVRRAAVSGWWRVVVVFGIGVVLAVGAWLGRNLADTGNPVYPLAWSVFGGRDWTPEIDARWRAAHGPPNFAIADLASRVVDVTLRSDWQSPLLFGLAPLVLLQFRLRRASWPWWLFIAWMLGTWWLLTHRIDRFWVPVLPVVALLAGGGLTLFHAGPARWLVSSVAVLLVLFNLVFANVFGGYNAWFRDPDLARHEIRARVGRLLLAADEQNAAVADPGVVLSVGDAAVFEVESDLLYNTVFDLNVFQQLTGERVTGGPDADVRLRPPEEVRLRLESARVRFVAVNWSWVLRYRSPGNYGYSHFVRPETFESLVQAGILRRVVVFRGRIAGLQLSQRQLVRDWQVAEGDWFPAEEVFEVLKRTEEKGEAASDEN